MDELSLSWLEMLFLERGASCQPGLVAAVVLTAAVVIIVQSVAIAEATMVLEAAAMSTKSTVATVIILGRTACTR